MCGFPKLIAACHVLHRLFLPRHPPCALSSLTIELIPRRKRSCCLLPGLIPCIFPPVRLTGYDPRLRTLSKDTQLTSLTISNLIETISCSALYAIYPMQFVVKEQNAAFSSARHRALSSSARLKLDAGRACSKISLFYLSIYR